MKRLLFLICVVGLVASSCSKKTNGNGGDDDDKTQGDVNVISNISVEFVAPNDKLCQVSVDLGYDDDGKVVSASREARIGDEVTSQLDYTVEYTTNSLTVSSVNTGADDSNNIPQMSYDCVLSDGKIIEYFAEFGGASDEEAGYISYDSDGNMEEFQVIYDGDSTNDDLVYTLTRHAGELAQVKRTEDGVELNDQIYYSEKENVTNIDLNVFLPSTRLYARMYSEHLSLLGVLGVTGNPTSKNLISSAESYVGGEKDYSYQYTYEFNKSGAPTSVVVTSSDDQEDISTYTIKIAYIK